MKIINSSVKKEKKNNDVSRKSKMWISSTSPQNRTSGMFRMEGTVLIQRRKDFIFKSIQKIGFKDYSELEEF